MQSIDADKFRNLIRGMGRMYGSEPDALVLDAYWIALSDWDLSDFEDACRHLMKTAKFMPRPSEFNELRKAGRMTSAEAWSKAIQWVRNGVYRHPAKTDEALEIDRVVSALGGWAVLANCADDRLSFLERRFCDRFDMLQEVTETRESVPQIAHGYEHSRISHDSHDA